MDKKTKELLSNIQSEIIAGGILKPKTDEDRAYNQAVFRAKDIIENYKKGKGLFQLGEKK